jgi:hypothetical protein
MKRSGIDVTSTALLDAIACDLGRAASAIAAAESKARELGLKNTVREMKALWKDLVRSGRVIERHKSNARLDRQEEAR